MGFANIPLPAIKPIMASRINSATTKFTPSEPPTAKIATARNATNKMP